jgi:uncharacterized protein (DUF362 family)/NAD-dependent dihydropyrimidine dehydrogenase PreA subunit
MDKSRVALVRCAEYQDDLVYQAVKKGLDLLGGTGCFVKSGEKIVLKPNVLLGTSPEKCVTTHPAVFKAVGRLFLEAGAKVSYGDSSSIGGCEFNMKRAKLKQAGDELGLSLADFDHGRSVIHKSALLNKRFTFAKGVLDADGLVSLPKMKTHQLTRFTGCVKNQFGCIPGVLKGQFHVKMSDPYNFGTMLVDINTFLKPRLYVMDGIIAMEGNGPRSGKPRPMNVVLFSSDPIALDSIACKMINLNPEFVPTAKPGEKSGLGTYHYENIEILGDDLDSFVVKDFRVTRLPPARATEGRLRVFLRNLLTPRPIINKDECTKCGVCIDMCPVGPTALDWMRNEIGKAPNYNYDRCIRCYCCQETCPSGAITVKSPFFIRLVNRE